MKKRTSQKERVLTALARAGKSYPGITISAVAKRANTPRANVMKRVYDLRNEGFNIETNVENQKVYYSLA